MRQTFRALEQLVEVSQVISLWPSPQCDYIGMVTSPEEYALAGKNLGRHSGIQGHTGQ